MPNIKKVVAGDYLYIGNNQLTVTSVDPIQLFVGTVDQNGVTKEYRPWQLSLSPWKKPEDRKRKREKRVKNKEKKEENEEKKKEEEPCEKKARANPDEERDESMDCKDNGDISYFKFVLRDDGLEVRVGELYSVSCLGNDTPFLVTEITGRRNRKFLVSLMLVSVENSVVKDIVKDFKLSVGIEFVNRNMGMKKSSKFSSYVNNLIFEARSRMSCELLRRGSWYRILCRKFQVGSIIRNNVASNIIKMARLASVNIGSADITVDPYLFNLNDTNKYQVTFNMSDFDKLDGILGSRWDIKPHRFEDPNSFFSYVTKLIVSIDKQDLLKVRFTYAGSTFPLCENYRNRIADSNAVQTELSECSASEPAVSLS